MHELGVTRSILKICLSQLDDENFEIKVINLKIGELSGYIPEVIEHYFKLVAKDTRAEGAKINSEIIDAKMECRNCGKSISVDMEWVCPRCLTREMIFHSGKDFMVESIEIDEI